MSGDLLERLRAATGADRRLDLDICAALGTLEYGPTARGWTRHPHPELTASLDAALALVERVLPGWTVASISQQDDKTWSAELREGFLTSYGRVALSSTLYGQRPPTPALALLCALLSALSEPEAGRLVSSPHPSQEEK